MSLRSGKQILSYKYGRALRKTDGDEIWSIALVSTLNTLLTTSKNVVQRKGSQKRIPEATRGCIKIIDRVRGVKIERITRLSVRVRWRCWNETKREREREGLRTLEIIRLCWCRAQVVPSSEIVANNTESSQPATQVERGLESCSDARGMRQLFSELSKGAAF